MKYKYPFHTMEVGAVETITTCMKARTFQFYVYTRAQKLNRRFTTLKVSDGVFEVRRIDGLPDEDKLALSRSRSAKLRNERRLARKQESAA